jgi:TonB-linked SusC/RagA family outer membrane protein
MRKILYVLLFFLVGSVSLSAQQKEVYSMTGIVYDETGETVPGASVYLKDRAGIGTATDSNGKFSIKASLGDMLVFSFLGYENVEYLVTEEKKDLQIRFSTATHQIDEVVIVGMGSQRKISSVAAITTVDIKELQVPSASVANLLGGKVAGVISMQTSGEPGQNIAEFWVRGIGTFGASSGALVLIDGLEGDINSVDPADIESFSVLKDASATAVYGVRGANGVVLINTKKGETGKLQITARTNFTLSHLNRVPQYLRANDYAQLANEARAVRGETPLYSAVEMDIIRDGLDPDMYPDVSWQDEILNRNSYKQTYYVSARGGSDVARYFLSLGTSSETAAYKVDKKSPYSSNVGYNTYNFRTNLDINLSKSTSVYFGSDGYLSILDEPGIADTDYIWKAQSRINPLSFPTVYSNGAFPGRGSNDLSSPYVLINRTGTHTTQKYKGKMTLALNQDLSMLLDGLKFRLQGAYDLNSYFTEKRSVQPALYQAFGRNTIGELVLWETVKAETASYSKSVDQYRKYHLESTLNYDRTFAKDHRVSGLVYYYISDQKDTDDIDDAKDNKESESLAAIPIRYQGVSSRFTYSFRDTYMLDVNFGYTGSENFQPGRQYGFFPSLALGWVPTGYAAVNRLLPWLDFLKIRASYGTVGNDRITSKRFPYQTKVNVGSTKIWEGSSVETINEVTVGADNLEWEKALKADVGIEGRLFRDKFSFVLDFFNDQRDGIFQQRVQVPNYVGVITMPYGNVGRMKSYGADGNAAWTQKLNQDMSFTLRGNFTYSKNEIQNWEQAYMEYPYLEYSGFPNGVIRGYQAIGLFKDDDDIKYSPIQTFGDVMPGDIKYKDVNGDGKIDALDKVPLSYDTYPLLMYGVGGEFRYGNFTAGILFKGTGKTDFFYVGQTVKRKNKKYENGMGYVPFYDGPSGNVLLIANDPANRWIPMDYALANGIDPALAENPNARFPRLQYGMNNNNAQLSSFWKGDARYLRLQEVTLNYNLKNNWLRKAGISSIDIQLVGNNLYIWDKVKIFDPEQAQFNGEAYPIPATYTIQLYINL